MNKLFFNFTTDPEKMKNKFTIQDLLTSQCSNNVILVRNSGLLTLSLEVMSSLHFVFIMERITKRLEITSRKKSN